ncbi:MAG: helix-turn-helix domain-containing protein [Limisphaerales bacterium]
MLSHTGEKYQSIIRKVETTAQTYTGEKLHIRFLCKTCGISERVLRNAYHSVYGKTPYRHLREQRMMKARQTLLHPDSPTTTVTSVAMQFGFLELGRFSVEYRTLFGECPSETLRHSSVTGYARDRNRLGPAELVVVQSAA